MVLDRSTEGFSPQFSFPSAEQMRFFGRCSSSSVSSKVEGRIIAALLSWERGEVKLTLRRRSVSLIISCSWSCAVVDVGGEKKGALAAIFCSEGLRSELSGS